ncbi:hypothetical protein EZ449_18950 [Pedobacter frigidisoli]|uniref:Uncharacterized protein n=1 Tax=Pedobacter frigidisoli TaxID=2530455 RepID=A0A4R0NPH3_9SPHI|nr:tetratricopeptide repeat protein [Pedobacter frigidisoli]TCD02139.1 hypothetical protein EZ449_18950 [Pedobacter frigidisoli]
MKKLFITCLLLSFSTLLFSQISTSIDKEKLFDFYQTQRYADAATYLKSIYGEDVKDTKILTQIGYCFLMAGNNVEAEKYYSIAYATQPQNLPILFSLASINAKRGNNEKAKNYYSEIVKIDSNNFNVYKLLANLYNEKDSMKLVYLLKANKINPLEGDVAEDLADVHSVYQEYEKAYQVLDIAIKADSENLVLQRAKLPIANQLKKYNEVISSGERLLRDLIDAAVIKDVAKAYYFTKQYQNAINLFKTLEVLSMQNEATLYYTALSYRALKNFPKSSIYTKKTIDEAISPNTSSYYALLGLVYQENNQFSLAAAAFKKGLTFRPNPTIYYRLAKLYDTKFKQTKTALSYYNKYLKSKPSLKDEKEEIQYTKDRIAQLKPTD